MPNARSHEAWIASWTPSAVHGLGSPELPRSTRQAGDVARALGDHGHVGVGGADVLGGPVAAVEHLDGLGEVEQHLAPLLGAERRLAGAAHDHALAAALGEAGDGGLEGHRAREPERVGDGVARVRVGPHAAAAERRAERRRVDGDDREQARPPAAADEQLLVLEGLQVAVDAPRLAGGVPRGGAPPRRAPG